MSEFITVREKTSEAEDLHLSKHCADVTHLDYRWVLVEK